MVEITLKLPYPETGARFQTVEQQQMYRHCGNIATVTRHSAVAFHVRRFMCSSVCLFVSWVNRAGAMSKRSPSLMTRDLIAQNSHKRYNWSCYPECSFGRTWREQTVTSVTVWATVSIILVIIYICICVCNVIFYIVLLSYCYWHIDDNFTKYFSIYLLSSKTIYSVYVVHGRCALVKM